MKNIHDVQKAVLEKKEFTLSSKTTHNDDYCLLFNLNLMVVRVAQTVSKALGLMSHVIEVPLAWSPAAYSSKSSRFGPKLCLVMKPDICIFRFSDYDSSKHLRGANINKWNISCMGSYRTPLN